MSDEVLSSEGSVGFEISDNSSEYGISEKDKQVISTVNEYMSHLEAEHPVSLVSDSITLVGEFSSQPRVVVDVVNQRYGVQLYESSSDPYYRNHIEAIFLNGTEVSLQESGLELFDVTVFIYKTEDNAYIASLWTD